MQVADTGNGILVSNYEMCPGDGPGALAAPLRVHIWHPDQPGYCPVCNPAPVGLCTIGAAGLTLCYREHEPFPEKSLAVLVDYARQRGRLLIHCAAGVGRAPTLAVACHAARGHSPFRALGRISRALWRDYGIQAAPNFDRHLLETIFRHFAG